MLYLLHFDQAFGHARHYLGFVTSARTLDQRLEHHADGSGARLMRAVSRAGIQWRLVRTWAEGDRNQERRLKKQGAVLRLCPECGKKYNAERWARRTKKKEGTVEKLKFQVVVKRGLDPDIVVEPRISLDPALLTLADGEKIIETEQFLEKLTGWRVHINQVL
jgi:hypothetical protein